MIMTIFYASPVVAFIAWFALQISGKKGNQVLNLTLLLILIGSAIVALISGGYSLKRYINWNAGYDDKVVEQVCQMVKPEHLKEKYKKICAK